MAGQWVIHLNDGKSLTDDTLYPHEVDVLRSLGYGPDQITSIDRTVGDHTLTIRARNMDTFFVGTEAGVDLIIAAGRRSEIQQKPAEITKKFIGGYIKGIEPFLQARLGMDPKTGIVYIEFIKTTNKAPLGINAQLHEPRKGKFIQTFQRELQGKVFVVFDNRYVENVDDCEGGFICTLKEPMMENKSLTSLGTKLEGELRVLSVMVHLKNRGIVLEVL